MICTNFSMCPCSHGFNCYGEALIFEQLKWEWGDFERDEEMHQDTPFKENYHQKKETKTDSPVFSQLGCIWISTALSLCQSDCPFDSNFWNYLCQCLHQHNPNHLHLCIQWVLQHYCTHNSFLICFVSIILLVYSMQNRITQAQVLMMSYPNYYLNGWPLFNNGQLSAWKFDFMSGYLAIIGTHTMNKHTGVFRQVHLIKIMNQMHWSDRVPNYASNFHFTAQCIVFHLVLQRCQCSLAIFLSLTTMHFTCIMFHFKEKPTDL